MFVFDDLTSTDVAHRLGWTLVHSLWLGGAVAALLGITLMALRRRSAQARYVASCVALVLIVIVPVAVFPFVAGPATEPVVDEQVAGLTPLEPLGPVEPLSTVPPLSTAETPALPPLPDVETTSAPPTEQAESIAPASESLLAMVSHALKPALPWMSLAWIVGVFALSLWRLTGWMVTLRLRHLAVPIDDPSLIRRLERLARALRITRPVQLLESALMRVPAVIGCLKPAILLPVGLATGLSSEQLEAILAHELAHIRRWDYLVNLLQSLAETILFYHPAVWWLSRRIRLERENCCDDMVLATGAEPLSYAESLVQVAHRAGGGAVARPRAAAAALGATGVATQLRHRIHRLLGRSADHGPARAGWLAVALVGLVVTGLTVYGCMGESDSASQLEGPAFLGQAIDQIEVIDVQGAPATPATLKRMVTDVATIRKIVDCLDHHPAVPSGGMNKWQLRLSSSGTLVKDVFVYDDGEWHYDRKTRGISAELPDILHDVLKAPERLGKASWPEKLDETYLAGAWLHKWQENEDGQDGSDYELLIMTPDRRWAKAYVWGEPSSPDRVKVADKGVRWEVGGPDHYGNASLNLWQWIDPEDPSHRAGPGGGSVVLRAGPTQLVLQRFMTIIMQTKYQRCDKAIWQTLSKALAGSDAPSFKAYPEPPAAEWPGRPDDARLVGAWLNSTNTTPQRLVILRKDRTWVDAGVIGDPQNPEKVTVYAHGKRWHWAADEQWFFDQVALAEPAEPGQPTGLQLTQLRPSRMTTAESTPQMMIIMALTYVRLSADVAAGLEKAIAEAGVGEEATAWGEAVEGVEVRLRAERPAWKQGEVPTLVADVRNTGELKLRGSPRLDYTVQVDGQWYRFAHVFSPESLDFGPGTTLPDTTLPLMIEGAKSKAGYTDLTNENNGMHLKLLPGRHTVRVAFQAWGQKQVRAVSNPVEIEILPAENDVAAWPQAVEGVEVRLRAERRKWPVGQSPVFELDMRNQGNLMLSVDRSHGMVALRFGGKRYSVKISPDEHQPEPFGPGNSLSRKVVVTGARSDEDGRALKLGLGKHVLQAEVIGTTLERNGPVVIVSNPVEIEILPADVLGADGGGAQRVTFLGLDLTDAPRTTKSSELPDLYEERPPGSGSYELRAGVVVGRHPEHFALGDVFYVPDKDAFYVQHDPIYSSTLTYYGPFKGKPWQRFGIPETETRQVVTWGEAVEGVEVRVRADTTDWPADRFPVLSVDIRNSGPQEHLAIVKGQRNLQLEVDGRWYVWPGHLRGGEMPPLGVGTAIEGQQLILSPMWQEAQPEELQWRGDGVGIVRDEVPARLQLAPGRHLVRVAAIVEPARAGVEGFRIVSAPVTLEIKAPAEGRPGAWPISAETAQAVSNLSLRWVIVAQPAYRGERRDEVITGLQKLRKQAETVRRLAGQTALDDEAQQVLRCVSRLSQELKSGQEDKQTLRELFQALGAACNRLIRSAGGETAFTWGEAVEGVQVRLRAEKLKWTVGESPAFEVEIRNQGNLTLSVDRSHGMVAFTLGGKLYGVMVSPDKHQPKPFGPGDSLKRRVALTGAWTAGVGEELKLGPGKHVLQAEVLGWTPERNGPIVVRSNPVEIDVELSTLPLNETVERIIYDTSHGRQCGVDLDSGWIFDTPNLRAMATEHDAKQARKLLSEGMDAACQTIDGDAGPGIFCFETKVVPVIDNWDDIRLKRLVSDLETVKVDSIPAMMSAGGQLPRTYGFQTREGNVGVLEIIERSKTEPRHLRIRVKLVGRAGAGASQKTESDTKAEATSPESSKAEEEASWGKAVEGVQVRLQVGKRHWKAGTVPVLVADARNQGGLELRSSPRLYYEVEIDGQWFRRDTIVSPESLDFGPGKAFLKTEITLDSKGQNVLNSMGLSSKETGKPLQLLPGKHTVRAAFTATGDKVVRAVSNAAEIEIVPDLSATPAALNAYLAVCDFLRQGGSRVEAAKLFRSVSRMVSKHPGDDQRKAVASDLAGFLEAMAKEDRTFVPPGPPLTEQQRVDLLVYRLRDVAETAMFVPGRVQVLMDKGPESPARQLADMGPRVVPRLIALLEDRRPTRSVDAAPNGGHVLRYADVALQIIDSIAGQPDRPIANSLFDGRPGRGMYLGNADKETQQKIIGRVKAWWAAKQKADGAAWGKTVEGVQVRLRAEKLKWQVGQTPVLKLDVRNDGARSVSLLNMGDLSSYCDRIEVDEQRYSYNRLVEHLGPDVITLKKGQERVDAGEVRLDRNYVAFDDNRPLVCRPGRHTVRVWCRPDGFGALAVSNPIEIEILPVEDDAASSGAAAPAAPEEGWHDDGFEEPEISLEVFRDNKRIQFRSLYHDAGEQEFAYQTGGLDDPEWMDGLRDWAKKKELDVSPLPVELHAKQISGFIGLNMAVLGMDSKAWDRLSIGQVVRTLKDVPAEPVQVVRFPAAELPKTFLIRTWNGNPVVLQLVAVTDNGTQIRVKYGRLDWCRNVLPGLLNGTEDPDVTVRAIRILAEVGDVQAIPALRQLSKHENALIQKAAEDALTQIGNPTAPAEPTPQVRKEIDERVAKAGEQIRLGLQDLARHFPQLKRSHEWQSIVEPVDAPAGWLEVRLYHAMPKKAPDPTPESERFRLTVDVRPPQPPGADPRFPMLYPNLNLVGRVETTAGDPTLEMYLKKLLAEALAPLGAMDRELGHRKAAAMADGSGRWAAAATSGAIRRRDLSGTWAGKRDGTKATIEFHGNGDATWRIEGPSTTIAADLRLVDDEQAGTISLRLDYVVGATGKKGSAVIGRLERTASAGLALSVLPAATELESDYRPVMQIPLHEIGPRKAAAADAPDRRAAPLGIEVDGRPKRVVFLGLDLTDAPHTTKVSELPDLYVEQPLESGHYELSEGVVVGRPPKLVDLEVGDGEVYYVPAKGVFYVRYDSVLSSTRTYYGPFRGKPWKRLGIPEPAASREKETSSRGGPHDNRLLAGVDQIIPEDSGASPVMPERNSLVLQVVRAATGEPLAGASIEVAEWLSFADQRQSRFVTDSEGRYRIPYDLEIEGLVISVGKHDGVVSASLGLPRGQIPAEFVMELPPAATVGGVVHDEQGQPIKGAAVHLMASQKIGKTGMRTGITEGEIRTDDRGRWRCDSVPEKLTELRVRLDHPDYVSDKIMRLTSRGETAGITAFYDQTAVLVMKKGLPIRGRVLGTDDRPVEGAKVLQGRDRWGSFHPDTVTDVNGEFAFPQNEPGEIVLTVLADGHAPALKQVDLTAETPPLDFQLERSHTIRGRVVDAAGRPVADATVFADTWHDCRTLQWRASTDAEGRFAWTDAPADAVKFHVLKSGHMSVRDATLVPLATEHSIVLRRPLRVRGRVTDADTGEPVPEFRVAQGIDWGNGRPHTLENEHRAGRFSDGQYDVTFDYPRPGHYVLVSAEGYLPQESRVIKGDEGNVTIDVALKRGSGPNGVILGLDGKPLADATVVLATVINQAVVHGSTLVQKGKAVVTTGADGRFSFKPEVYAYCVAALHDDGFIEIPGEEFANGKAYRLRPWGRIEGTLVAADGAVNDKKISVSSVFAQPGQPVYKQGLSTMTDRDGGFVVNRVAPGDYRVGREVQLKNNWVTMLDSAMVTVEAGKRARVKIGGKGRPVVGRIVIPPELKANYDDSVAVISVDVDWPEPDVPKAVSQMNIEDREKWFAEWKKTEAGKAHEVAKQAARRRHNSTAVAPDEDGTFRIEGVPSEQYVLHVNFFKRPAKGRDELVANVRHEFTVPPMPDGRSDKPFDLGNLPATVLHRLKVGDTAPLFEAQTFDGRSLKLADYRGKFVLLDFWAVWCTPCRFETPHLKTVYQTLKDDERFAMISIDIDKESALARKYVEKEKLDWIHGHLDEKAQSTVSKDYGVLSIPAIFLIGPDGKVIAKELRGKAILAAVQKALEAARTSRVRLETGTEKQ